MTREIEINEMGNGIEFTQIYEVNYKESDDTSWKSSGCFLKEGAAADAKRTFQEKGYKAWISTKNLWL